MRSESLAKRCGNKTMLGNKYRKEFDVLVSRFTATSADIPEEILGLEWEADVCLVLAHRIRSDQQLEKARSNRSHLMREGA